MVIVTSSHLLSGLDLRADAVKPFANYVTNNLLDQTSRRCLQKNRASHGNHSLWFDASILISEQIENKRDT